MLKRDRWGDSSDEDEPPRNSEKYIKKKITSVDREASKPLKEVQSSTAAEAIVTEDFTGTDSVTKSAVYTEEKSTEKTHIYNFLVNGCRSVDEYERISYISQGTFGLVYKAKCNHTNDIVALKEVKLTADVKKIGFPVTALREINILLALRHPNIIRVREMVVGSTLDKIYMVMDFYDNDLKTCMEMSKQSFSTAEVKQLMIQLLDAINFMHSHWYLHRDLKTSNLLYSNSDGRLCVCDFGLARKFGSPIAPYTFEVVTLWYRAPELLLGSRVYSTPLDMWSAGCIFAEMLTGKPLFPGQGEVDQLNLVFRLLGSPNDAIWPGFSMLPNSNKVSWRTGGRNKLREYFPVTSFSGGVSLNETGFDLLSRLLHMDPSQRISASDAINHPWLQTELPKPCPLELMPKFRKNGELEADIES